MDSLERQDCLIESAILHKLDNREDQLTLADEALQVDGVFGEFIADHVVSSLTRANIAVFENREVNVVRGCCEAVFGDATCFIERSRMCAQHLFAQMRAQSIKPGMLLVALCRDTSQERQFVALMKLDNTRAFTHEEVTEGDRTFVRVNVNDNALPNTEAKLDKAAFVLPTSEAGEGYDLKLIDRGHSGDSVARFFQAFLDCKSPQTDKEKTRIFNRAVEQWIQQNREELPDTVREGFLRDHKTSYLQNNDRVNVAQFADQAFGEKNPALRESLMQHLRASKLQDAEFAVELPPAETRRTIYQFARGDQKVQIRGNSDAVKELVEVQEPTADRPFYRVIIEAEEWTQPPR